MVSSLVLQNLGQNRGIDFVGAYEEVQDRKNTLADRANAAADRQRQEQARALAGRALTGDASAMPELATANPEAFMAIEGRNASMAKAKVDAAEAAHIKSIDEATRVLGGATTKEAWAAGIALLKKNGHEFDPEEEDFNNRDAFLNQALSYKDQLANRIATQNAETARLNATKGSEQKPNSAIAKLNEDLANNAITPEQYRSELKRLNAPGIGIGPNGQLQNNPAEEPLPLGKAAANAVQKDAVAGTMLIQQTDNIKKLYDPKFLQYLPKLSAWKSSIANKAGSEVSAEDKDFLSRKTKFDNGVERLFNAYRKEITGAAAAVQELERLKKSFLNVDMSPIEFEASLGEYQSELKRTFRLRLKLLRTGLDPNTAEGGAAFDSEFLGGGDDAANERGAEIQASNPEATQDEILQQLESEGYEQ